MGDGADMALEAMEDFEDLRLSHKMGQMTDAEAYEHGIINELGGIIGTEGKIIKCRCCGEVGLHWEKIEDKWRLFNNEGLHDCKANPLKT